MAPRSRTGCMTCRQRKLKCSEEKPTCSQCAKANRGCVPSSGITFRHQQNPSMNGEHGNDSSLRSFYSYKETFGKGVRWVEVPKDLTFIHTSNPYEDKDGDEPTSLPGRENGHREQGYSLPQAAYPAYATHGLEALSAVASQDQYSYAPAPPTISQHVRTSSLHSQPTTSPQQPNTTPSQNSDFRMNLSSDLSPVGDSIDPSLSHTPISLPALPSQLSHVRTASMASLGVRPGSQSKGTARRSSVEEPELAFLLRNFAERPGLWMDLFDLGLFFATKVPVLAVSCPLLLYACACLSAKSLARLAGTRSTIGGQFSVSRQSKMEFWPGPPLNREGWAHKGGQYYDIAISLLRQAIEGAARPPTSSLPEDATLATICTAQDVPLPTTDSDELVAATAILCVYQFLDASGTEWSRHLDGTNALFDIAKDRMVPLTLPPSPVSVAQQVAQRLAASDPAATRRLSKGRRAVFWNFARQDMLWAFINNTCTRLDTGDLPMWRSAGLKLTSDGYVATSNPESPDYIEDQAMADDMISNALVWLSMKLINFITAGDDVDPTISPLGLGIRQHSLLSYWETLSSQLRTWHDSLPSSFHPTANHHSSSETETERWFPRAMCASTMQWYHFARVQLLHNKPHLSTGTPSPGGTGLASRHASYASILQRSRFHAKEIVAISRSRSDEGTRIHAVQPLWTAGLVLGMEGGEEAETWRRVIVELLRGIEQDMGWASEYRVQSLLQLWGEDAADGWPEISQ